MRKPKLFIASSAESLSIAEAVNVNLDHEFEVTIWTNGTFKLSSTTIEDLVEKSSSVDFALFIFTPDDIATIRSRKEHIVRDNVIFEMGLFIGSIGKDRSFILKPRGTEVHLPTDLLGTTPADYEPNRMDGDLVSATNRACSLIKSEVERIGLIDHVSLSETKRFKANPVSYELSEVDFHFLASCLKSQTSDPDGLPYHRIVNEMRGVSDPLLQIAAIKLERMGFVEKTISTDNHDGYDYFSYAISEIGIDTLLKNEEKLQPKPQAKGFSDDEAPF